MLELEPDERSRLGMFLAFQYPHAIPGVTVANFLRRRSTRIRKARPRRRGRPDLRSRSSATSSAPRWSCSRSTLARQPLPQRRLLGRREEARRDPADGDAQARARDPRRDRLRPRHRRAARSSPRASTTLAGPELGVLVITHYQRILNYIRPDYVHVLVDGRIVQLGRSRARARARGRGLRGRRRAARRSANGSGHRHRSRRRHRRRLQVRLPQTRGLPVFKTRAGLDERRRRARSRRTRTSRSGCSTSASRRSRTSGASRCRRGAATSPSIDFENIFYYLKPTEKNAQQLGRRAGRHQEHVRPARHPRGRAEVPRRRRRAVRVRGRLPQPAEGPRGPGRDLPRHRLRRCSEHEDLFREYFGTIIPPTDNKFAALNSAVWSGGSFIYVPKGVKVELPLQAYFRINAQEHGPVRADADHRRRGRLRALRRGLHGADVLERLAALGGRRDHRQEGRPLPLHDHPELVEQRLQPRHQARGRLRGRHDGVGRRQPRLEADDEVPGGHPARSRARTARCSRSRSPARASTRTPAPRSSHMAPEHDLGDHVEVDLARAAAAPSTAACCEVDPGATGAQVEGRLRRADPRRAEPLRHVPVHQHRRERGRHRARGDGLEDRRGAALLPDEPRALARPRPPR